MVNAAGSFYCSLGVFYNEWTFLPCLLYGAVIVGYGGNCFFDIWEGGAMPLPAGSVIVTGSGVTCIYDGYKRRDTG